MAAATAPPHPDDEGREKLRHFTLLRFLGSGTFAEVSAYASPAGPVAIKKVSRQQHDKGINLGALKELQVLQELSAHPNLVSLLDVFAFGERMHLVLELCDFSLDSVARDTRVALPEAERKPVTLRVAVPLTLVAMMMCRGCSVRWTPSATSMSSSAVQRLSAAFQVAPLKLVPVQEQF